MLAQIAPGRTGLRIFISVCYVIVYTQILRVQMSPLGVMVGDSQQRAPGGVTQATGSEVYK